MDLISRGPIELKAVTLKLIWFDFIQQNKYTCCTDNDVTYIMMPRIAQESSMYLFPLWSFHNKIAD